MPYEIVEFETTPNPNAMRCRLDSAVSDGVQSFLRPEMAEDHPLAAAIFADTGATTLLFNGEWMTINKPADANWPAVKTALKNVLASWDDS